MISPAVSNSSFHVATPNWAVPLAHPSFLYHHPLSYKHQPSRKKAAKKYPKKSIIS